MSEKVLLVEDDPTTRLILTSQLRAAGYDVLLAEDGAQAMVLLRSERIALIVSDWMMPNRDGLELCSWVKNEQHLGPSYFIMMTARGEKTDCIQGLEVGADDYLSKPVDEGELIARVKAGERVIARQRALQDLAGTDPLTGLRNLRLFEEDLEAEMALVAKVARSFSLLLLDLDDFREVNDMWGRAKGDEALRVFGRFLVRTLRQNDHLYRIGGDEFAILLPEAMEMESEMTAERLKGSFSLYRNRHVEDVCLPSRFSIGSITVHPGSGLSRKDILEAAGERMVLDKGKGGGEVPEMPPTPVEVRKGTILVVDDEPVTRKILHKGLSSFGYSVLIAEDGETCLDILSREKPDVLLLDWILPGIDGLEVCRTIRADRHIEAPYIIMVTMVGGSKSRIYALDNGADDYIGKPIDMEELLARVRVGLRMEDLKRRIAMAEKLKGVIQMAGAAAHELSQPLTSLMGLVDLVIMRTDPSDPNYKRLQQIVGELQRLGDLTKKIGRIVKYETRDYLGDTKIVDIDKASQYNPNSD